MTSAAPVQRAVPQMTHTPDPIATPPAESAASAGDARPAPPRLRDQIAENPLLSLFGGAVVALLTILGTVVVALLVFTLTGISDRIDSLGDRIDRVEVTLGDRIDSLGDRIDRVEVTLGDRIDSLGERIDRVEVTLGDRIDSLGERIDRLEAKVDAGFAAQGAQIAELDRKLTALIVHLNAAEAVEAALEHRLFTPGASALEPDGEPPG